MFNNNPAIGGISVFRRGPPDSAILSLFDLLNAERRCYIANVVDANDDTFGVGGTIRFVDDSLGNCFVSGNVNNLRTNSTPLGRTKVVGLA